MQIDQLLKKWYIQNIFCVYGGGEQMNAWFFGKWLKTDGLIHPRRIYGWILDIV